MAHENVSPKEPSTPIEPELSTSGGAQRPAYAILSKHLLTALASHIHWLTAAVYGGAALLLVLVGLRYWSRAVSGEVVIAALVLEALLLVLLSVAISAAPRSSSSAEPTSGLQEYAEEIRSIASEIADITCGVAERHEQLLDRWMSVNEQQEVLLQRFAELLDSFSRLPAPGAALIEAVQQLRTAVEHLTATLQQTQSELRAWRQQELQEIVRQELARLVSSYVQRATPSAPSQDA
jgi:hypothetical protein